jgi:2-polyprenyl-3-methyl-5-hydroxy-6-metoxy-1,4-benzoquinol methylase
MLTLKPGNHAGNSENQTVNSLSTFPKSTGTRDWDTRLVDQFEPGQVVADVMAGVGPFAVPAAKKRCLVLGNDLNPESTRWMEKNRVDNRVCVCGQHSGLTSADIYAYF